MIYVAFAGCVALAGLLAGMLGVGGGLVTVPFVMAMAPALHIHAEVLPQTVVATSLAAMVPTTCAAAWAHRRQGAVDIDWVRRFIPGVSTGIVCTTVLFGRIAAPPLMLAFATYALWCGAHMLFRPAAGLAPATPSDSGGSAIARKRSLASVHVVAVALGAASAAAGLGGAFISVPYLLRQGLPMRSVLATSSAISFVVCTEGCLSYALLSPRGSQGIPVQWLVAVTVGLVAATAAPLGVVLSRRIPGRLLRRMFGALAIAAALSTLCSL